MPPPVVEKFLNKINRVNFTPPFKFQGYQLLPMASANPTNRESEGSPGKTDMAFSEDVEASRTSSKHDDTQIHRVELTEEDVGLP